MVWRVPKCSLLCIYKEKEAAKTEVIEQMLERLQSGKKKRAWKA